MDAILIVGVLTISLAAAMAGAFGGLRVILYVIGSRGTGRNPLR